ncbi:MAG: hypothetical protein ACOH2R_21685 [Pseudomonas sp.]
MTNDPSNAGHSNPIYDDPREGVLPNPGLKLVLSRTPLVVIDPQIDFLSPDGVAWGVVGNSVTETEVVGHLGQLFEAAKKVGLIIN